MPMTDLTPATTILLEYNFKFAYSDFSPIRMWLNEGCDMMQDIVPTLRLCMSMKKDITHISYFTKAVRRARDNRLDTERAIAAKGQVGGKISDATKARNIAFLTRKLGKRFPAEERWLADYESKNGEVRI
jgi:hypothetical protein